MNNQNRDSNDVSNQDMREFQTAENVSQSAGGSDEPNIQPSETENKNTNVDNKAGDPGRTPGKAEGDLETVEQDLDRQ